MRRASGVEPYDDPLGVLLEDVPPSTQRRIGFWAILVLAVICLAAAYGCDARIIPGSERKVTVECMLHGGVHHWYSDHFKDTAVLTAVCNDGMRVSGLIIKEDQK